MISGIRSLRDPEKTGLESEGSCLRFGSRLFQGTRVGLDEVAHCTNDHVTESDIGLICNGLKEVFFVRGNADCHDPVASFGHVVNIRRVHR